MDNLTTEMLDRMEVGEIAELGPDALEALATLCAEELVAARRRDNNLHKAMEYRYAGRASEKLLADGRDTGTIKFDDGRFEVTVTRPKRVKWDSAKLRSALDTLDPDEARHLAKVDVKVDERKFSAASPRIQSLLADARTVETGKATYCLTDTQAQGEAA